MKTNEYFCNSELFFVLSVIYPTIFKLKKEDKHLYLFATQCFNMLFITLDIRLLSVYSKVNHLYVILQPTTQLSYLFEILARILATKLVFLTVAVNLCV